MPNTPEPETDPLVARCIPAPRYLGDGVYIKSSGWGTSVNLTTSNGRETTNLIVLDPGVMRALKDYMEDLKAGVTKLWQERERRDGKNHEGR